MYVCIHVHVTTSHDDMLKRLLFTVQLCNLSMHKHVVPCQQCWPTYMPCQQCWPAYMPCQQCWPAYMPCQQCWPAYMPCQQCWPAYMPCQQCWPAYMPCQQCWPRTYCSSLGLVLCHWAPPQRWPGPWLMLCCGAGWLPPSSYASPACSPGARPPLAAWWGRQGGGHWGHPQPLNGKGKVKKSHCAEVSTHVGLRRHGNNPPLVCDSCVGVSVCSAAVGSCVTRPLWTHGRGQP